MPSLSLRVAMVLSCITLAILFLFPRLYKAKDRQDRSDTLLRGGNHPFLFVIFFLCITCFLYGVASIVLMWLKIDPLITLENSPILQPDESEELYSLLVTILLSLFATLITAYIFMIGALQGRKEYEKPAIQNLQAKTTRVLISLSVITSLCVVCIFIQESKNFTIDEFSWFQYTLVFISFIDIIGLLIYTYKIINYEKEISVNAKQILISCVKELCILAQSCDNVIKEKKLNEQLKMISDLEAIVTQCARNHKSSDRSRVQEMYNIVFEKIPDEGDATARRKIYENLVSLKDMLQILKDHGANVELLPLSTDLLKKVVGEIYECVTIYIMSEERFENLNFVDVDFSNGHFPHTSFRGAALINVRLTNACLCSACFAETILRNVSFWDADCKNADFTGTLVEISNDMEYTLTGDLTGAVFTNADLSGATNLLNRKNKNYQFSMKNTMCKKTNFLGLKLTGVIFMESVLTDAQLSQTVIEDCSFKNADLGCASLIGTVITCQSDFSGANLSEVKAAGARFEGTSTCTLKFDAARLERANFTTTRFQYCNFVGAYMNDANFVEATFKHCQFQGAILTCCDLSGCVMENCRLDYATLSKALIVAHPCKNKKTIKIIGTRFCHADFSGAALRGYTFEDCDFTKAVFDDAALRNVTFSNCVFHNSLFQNTLMVDVYWNECQSNTAGSFEDCVIFGTQEDRNRYRRFSHGM